MHVAIEMPRFKSRAEPGYLTLFYDGHCGLCHRLVQFLLKIDRSGAVRFAPLGGRTFHRIAERHRRRLPESVVLLTQGGHLLSRCQAVRRCLIDIGGPWALVGLFQYLIPSSLADAAYDALAAVRKRLFKAPEAECPLVPAHLRGRFLP